MARTLILSFLFPLLWNCAPAPDRNPLLHERAQAWMAAVQDLPNPTLVPRNRLEEFRRRAVDECWALSLRSRKNPRGKEAFARELSAAHQAWRRGLEEGRVDFDPFGVAFIKGFALDYGGAWQWVEDTPPPRPGLVSATLEVTTGYEHLRTDDLMPGLLITIMAWPPGRVLRVTTWSTPAETRRYVKTIRARIWMSDGPDPRFAEWETLVDTATWVEDTRSF